MARTAALPLITAESGLSRYLEEIRRFPMLERQEEYMLAKRWREHGDRDAGRGIRRLARARTPDRGGRLREGAECSEAPRRGDGDPGASAGALASNPLPWWEKLTMDVSLWGRFTATERREGAPLTGF